MPGPTPETLRRLLTLGPHTQRHARQLLAAHPLLQVSSAYRSPAHNQRVGGVPDSFHTRRRAIDLIGPEWDLAKAAGSAWAMRLGPNCTGPEEVLLEYLGTPRAHLHVAW